VSIPIERRWIEASKTRTPRMTGMIAAMLILFIGLVILLVVMISYRGCLAGTMLLVIMFLNAAVMMLNSAEMRTIIKAIYIDAGCLFIAPMSKKTITLYWNQISLCSYDISSWRLDIFSGKSRWTGYFPPDVAAAIGGRYTQFSGRPVEARH
jgi:hypothetical protein